MVIYEFMCRTWKLMDTMMGQIFTGIAILCFT